MIEDALHLQDIILKYQEDYKYPAEHRLSKKDFKAMKVLLELLKPLSILTEILSKSNVPMLANVLVHFDGLNQLYYEARLIALNTWEQYYKPEDYDNGDETASQSQFGYLTFTEEVYGSFAEENDRPIDPVMDFVDDLVPTGVLAKGHRKACKRNQANAQAKAAAAKAKAAIAEAEAIAAEQEQSEDEAKENGGSEYDNEDVLELSSEVEDINLEDD
ncbi:hypothetical protein FRC11_001783 [Ceratobasidium sp. 423]|nr:hypothetical protein FRC11_001783 [Ceratobasidium sp. 423]